VQKSGVVASICWSYVTHPHEPNWKYLPDAITEGEIELKRTGPNN
jgi:hypothetical protein